MVSRNAWCLPEESFMGVARPVPAAVLFLLALGGCERGTRAPYVFSQLDVPGATSVVAAGIDESGHIVGWYTRSDTVRGFVYQEGVYTPVEYPGAAQTHVYGIGPDGAIVGSYRNEGEGPRDFHGFLRTSSGEFIPIDSPGHKSTIAQRILPDGTILGCQHGDDYTVSMRGITVRQGVITALEVPATMTNGATPDGARMVGLVMDTHRGFVLERGVLTQFDAPDAVQTEAWDINASGTIVGVAVSPDSTTHGFVLDDGRFTRLDFPGATSTVAFGINAPGHIVGGFVDAAGQRHGYVAQRK